MLNMTRPAAGRRAAYLYLSLTTAIWGSLYVVTRIALETIPPVTLLFLRYAVASVSLYVMARAGRKSLRIERADRGAFLFIGAVGYFIAVAANILGTKYAGASAASLINATNPIFITLFAVLLAGEKFTAGKAIATVASLAGTYVILGGAGSPGTALGVAFSLVSVLIWAFVSVYVRGIMRRYDPLAVTALAVFIATVCSLPAAAVELALVPHGDLFSVTNLLCVLYLGSLATALPNFLWNKGLSLIEASTCSLFYPIQPLVAAAMGALLLGERLDLGFAVGAALIVGGIVYAVLAERRRAAA